MWCRSPVEWQLLLLCAVTDASSVCAMLSCLCRSPALPHSLCVVCSYFTRGSILEHLHFATRTVVQRTAGGTRQTVGLSDNPFLVHAYVRFDGLAGICVTQKDYAVRVAYSLINKVRRHAGTGVHCEHSCH